MPRRSLSWRLGRASELRPLLLLLAAIVVPTIGVLWFVGVAMKNEQLAGRQRLADAYRAHLSNLQRALDEHWQEKADRLERQLTQGRPDTVFETAIRLGFDGIVCFSESGETLYPGGSQLAQQETGADPRWASASVLEFAADGPVVERMRAAARAYAAIAEETTDLEERARAIAAEVRCLYKAAEDTEAVSVVLNQLGRDELSDARDAAGRLIVLNTYLMAIEKLAEADDPQFENALLPGIESGVRPELSELLRRLSNRISSYDTISVPAPQRLFLMEELTRLVPERVRFPTLPAERLAAKFLHLHPTPFPKSESLAPTDVPGVWHMTSSNERVVLLLKAETIVQVSQQIATAASLPTGIAARLDPPDAPLLENLLTTHAGSLLPGWRLSLVAAGENPPVAVTDQSALYLWTGILIVLGTCGTAILISQVLQRQLRLARLKSDLVGTVSHELKTPLASVRLLVDTLLESEEYDEQQTTDYLQLISKENARLTRLIDNFLTFSRMERGRIGFEFSLIDPAELIERAFEVAGERFRQPDCRVSTDVAEDLPPIKADEDALVTVVLNLLDNAYKYSESDREIEVRAYQDGGRVAVSVRDNGIGLSKKACKRVFQQFFQVDRTLARRNQGCGLGLSIVDYIVRAHGGQARVESQLGQGSTFTVSFPAAVR